MTNNQNERAVEIFEEMKSLIKELGEINKAQDQNEFGIYVTIVQNDEQNKSAKITSSIIGSSFLLAHAMSGDRNFEIINKSIEAYKLLSALGGNDNE